MRVFMTGASGWIGSAAVPGLLAAGHQVVGLARSEASASALTAAGVEVRRGDLDDVDSLRSGAADADAVIHLAFKHDFSDYLGAGRTERAALEAFGEELAGTGRPFLVASGTAGIAPGRTATEDDLRPDGGPDSPRGGGEAVALRLAERGVLPVSLRFSPTVHGAGDHGFLATLVAVARERGVAGYVGDGGNRWSAVHRDDVGRVIPLALAHAADVPVVHAVGEEAVTARSIAQAIGERLGVPTVSVDPADAATHFGWIGAFFALDVPASSTLTQQRLGWAPQGPGVLEDLAAGRYTGVSQG